MRLQSLKCLTRRRKKKSLPTTQIAKLPESPILKRVLFIRLGIFLSFCMMAIVLGASTYLLLKKNQMRAFKVQFESISSQMKKGIILSINSTISAGLLVSDIYSYAVQDGYVGKAPRITLPGFENIMEGINRLTQSHCIRFAPLLNESTRSSWESYAKANAHLFDGYNVNVSFGIYSPGEVYDKGHVSGSPYPNLLFPVWQTSPLAKTFQGIMSNPHSILDSRGEAIDRLISTNRHQMTKILQLDLQSSLRPASAFYTPIITIGKQGKLIGISIISFFLGRCIHKITAIFCWWH